MEDWLQHRWEQLAELRRHHELPPVLCVAVERFLTMLTTSERDHDFDLDLGYEGYVEDGRFLQVLSLDRSDADEGTGPQYLFVLWRQPGMPLSACPIVQFEMTSHADGTCSKVYGTLEAVAGTADEFMRLLATGIAGRDFSSGRLISIDPDFFRSFAEPYPSEAAAEQALHAAARRFDEQIPMPLGWGDED